MVLNLFRLIIILSVVLTVSLIRAESNDEPSAVLLVSEYNPPYIYKNRDGKFVGTSVSKLKPIFKQAGISYTMQTTPWKRALSMVNRQKNVLIYPLARTPERELKFKWLIPVHTVNFRLYGLKSNFNLKATDIISGKYSFVCADKTILCTALEYFGVPESSIIRIANLDDKQMIDMVFRGRVDFMVFSKKGLHHHFNKTDYDLNQLAPMENYNYPVVEYLAGKLDFDDVMTKKLRKAARIDLK